MIRPTLAGLLATVSLGVAAEAQDLTVTNAKLWTGDELIENATVIITDGAVEAAGADVSVPEGAEAVDAEGAWVTPGIFSAFSRTAIVEVGAEDSTNDTIAPLSSFGAALDMADAFNPNATTIPVTRLEGVTRIAVAPGFGAGMFGGRGFVADTTGNANSISEPRAFSFINLGEGGANLTGGSRAATWATFRGALEDARTFPAGYGALEDGDVLSRLDAEALAPASRGQQLLLIGVSRASDIRNVLELKQENPQLNIALVGAQEGWMVADELAEAEVPVIIDPYNNLPARFETLGSTQRNAERLIDAGVTTALAYLDDDSHQARLVLQSAGNAVANGVSHDDAMRAITSAPAEIYGLDGFGTLEAGSRGDLVIWDGDPLEVMSAPTAVYIDGVEQSLESRQTKLRDRYLGLDDSERPLAYRQ